MTTAVAVRERPILFSSAMVRAILDGRKSQTRRVLKPQPSRHVTDVIRCGREFVAAYPNRKAIKPYDFKTECPYGQPGDRLWVRETALYLKPIAGDDSFGDVMYADHEDFDICYPTKPNGKKGRRLTVTSIDLGWEVRPSIFMPRWASRLSLEITEVRVERLQDTSEEDASAEGLYWMANTESWLGVGGPYKDHRAAFAALWNPLNASRGYGWDANPWVWALSFKVVS